MTPTGALSCLQVYNSNNVCVHIIPNADLAEGSFKPTSQNLLRNCFAFGIALNVCSLKRYQHSGRCNNGVVRLRVHGKLQDQSTVCFSCWPRKGSDLCSFHYLQHHNYTKWRAHKIFASTYRSSTQWRKQLRTKWRCPKRYSIHIHIITEVIGLFCLVRQRQKPEQLLSAWNEKLDKWAYWKRVLHMIKLLPFIQMELERQFVTK